MLILGGYTLLHTFFAKGMPTPIQAGKYLLDMDDEKATCAFDAQTPAGALDCVSEDIPDANLTGGLGDAVQQFTRSTGAPADGVPVLDTPDVPLTVDISDEDRSLLSGTGRDLEITPDRATVVEVGDPS